MANGYVSSIQLPNDNTYNIKDKEIIPRLKATVGHSGKNQLSFGSQNLTKTIAGVTFTVDPVAGTVIANGTSTSSSGSQYFIRIVGKGEYSSLSNYPTRSIPNGKYYFCGCPSGGSFGKGTYNVYVSILETNTRAKKWDGSTNVDTDYGVETKNELLINDQSSTLIYSIRVFDTNGQNIVFRPMIWSGDIDDDTFEPYQEPTDSLIETKARAYLDSTVGHSGKNYISYDTSTYTYTANGITFTLDLSAGTVTANGTATANTEFRVPFNHITTIYGNVVYTKKPIKSGKYYFCGSPSGGTSTSYWCFVYDNTTGSGAKKWDGTSGVSRDYGDVHKNEVLIDDTHSQRFTILIANGYTASNVVFRPMIWSGDIDDDTFEPYIEPTDSLIETKARAYLNSTVGHVGKNYISYDTSTYTYTLNGVTFTLDPSAGTVTANGTATANTEFRIPFNHIMTISGGIVVYTKKPIKSGKYYFCGCPSGGTSTSYYCIVYDNTVGSIAKKWNGTSGADTDFGGISKNEMLIDDTHSQRFTISIKNGYTASNLVFRPMVWSGDIDDDTFEPYIEPTDSQIETKTRAYLNSSLGHVTKNLFNLSGHNAIPSGLTISTEDVATGRLVASATGAWKGIGWSKETLNLDPNKRYTITLTNNLANSIGRLCKRDLTNNTSTTIINLNTTGDKEYSFIPAVDFVSNYRLELFCTFSSASDATGSIDVSNFMIREASISDDTFEPYQEPTDKLIETKARAYLTSTVGHACKNLLDLTKYSASSNVTNIVINHETGSVSANASGSWQSIYFIDENIQFENGKTYVISCTNNAVNASGKLAIRNRATNIIYKFVKFDTVGVKSITFTPNTIDFPNGWMISLFITDVSGTAGNIDISNLMLREASITDDTFEPYVTPTDEKKQDKPVVLYDAGESSVGVHSVTGLSNLTQYSELHITLFAPYTNFGFSHTVIYPILFPNGYNDNVSMFDCWIVQKENGLDKIIRVTLYIHASENSVILGEFYENFIEIPSNHYIYIKRIVGIS